MTPPGPANPTPSLGQRLWNKIKTFGLICHATINRIGVWAFSVVATILAPCLPVGIELWKTGNIESASYCITTTVLAAAFAVSAGNKLFLSLYIVLFVINLVFYIVTGPFSPQLDDWAGRMLLMVAVLHGMQRVWWHIVLDRPFPD
jgi:hypothetical protein